MKQLIISAILFVSIGCSAQQVPPTKIAFKTGNKLVDRIGEIRNIPYSVVKFKGSKSVAVSWSCGDSLFWQIVKLDKAVIPYLIKKTQDSTRTDIKVPCGNGNLTVGAVAFITLNGIISTPYFLVFGSQWDSYEVNCGFGYPSGMLEYINKNPRETHEKLIKWYSKYGKYIKVENLTNASQTDCQKKYGIRHRLYVNY